MNREKFAWIASIALICLLAFQLPGTMAQRDDEYAFVRTLVDIHRHVTGNYVDEVSEEELRKAAIDGMLSRLDPYSVYVPPEEQEQFDRQLDGSFKGVGIQLNQLEDGKIEVVSPIDGSPAFEAGVMAGDIIIKVNGESVEGQRLPDVIKKIGGELNTQVTLTVRRVTGEVLDLTMTRQEIVVPTVKGFVRNEDNTWDFYVSNEPRIAYLRITQFTPETYDNLHGILNQLLAEGMKGLILDLRFNPGGRLDQAVKIVDMFIDHGVIVRTRGRNRPERTEEASVPDTLPYFPMIVLVNEYSASASEIVAGSLMDNRRALVIGERTYGKGSVQELIALDGEAGELKLTVAYYYLPSGRLVHRKKDADDWGVEPQIIIPMSDEQELATRQAWREQELFRRPVVVSATRPATQSTATQPVDVQLQQAVTTMIGLIVLQGEQDNTAGRIQVIEPIATGRPATQPAEPEPAAEPRPDQENIVPEDRLPEPTTQPATQPMI